MSIPYTTHEIVGNYPSARVVHSIDAVGAGSTLEPYDIGRPHPRVPA